MNVVSLFSGIGGLDHGLARAGFQHLLLCEGGGDPNGTKAEREQWKSGEWRRGVLRARFPGVPIYDDVRLVDHRLVGRVQAGDVDLVCGGFPCQDLSVAGRRAGLNGTRSSLFFEFARITDAFRPRWLLVENVPGLLSSNGGRDFGVVLGTLADIGYGLAWRVLDSRFFGVPQRRRRVFIIGALADGDPRAAAERAGQVLAVGSRCSRHPATRGEAREGTPGAPANGAGDGSWVNSGAGWWDDGDGASMTLSRRDWKGATTLIAAPLSHGSNPNPNMAGRRREDDENLVTGFHMLQDPISEDDLAPAWGKGNKTGTASIGVAVTPNVYNGCDADTAKAHAVEVLRRVRQTLGAETLCEWGLGIATALRAQAILRSQLHGGWFPGEAEEATIVAKRLTGGCTSPLARRAVLTLRRIAERRCPPQGRGPAEQLAGELRTALSELPQPRAQEAWLLHGLWEAGEGLGVLREALSTVQAVGRPASREDEPAHAAASVRRLTPTEAERLQALPDNWTNPHGDAPDSRRYAGLGDAVTASVGEWIGRRILAADQQVAA